MPIRRLLSHVLAGLAYGGLVQGCLGILLVTQYHGRADQNGVWTTHIDVFGTRWNPESMVALLFLLCICAPVLLSAGVAIFRPVAALERPPVLITHGLTLAFAIVVHLIVLFFAAMAGWNSTSF